ncbi:hypothetical protein QBC35DRAFT_470928 [Podospora australis]|uniref:Uncharacterized protein n=1 Tax=Podospora australis TaxID=1536484 RepID=A0AAN7AJP0_9PEZI|nr:hypothetical protein QBC35DRAFT_470928 [Podospora australis]
MQQTRLSCHPPISGREWDSGSLMTRGYTPPLSPRRFITVWSDSPDLGLGTVVITTYLECEERPSAMYEVSHRSKLISLALELKKLLNLCCTVVHIIAFRPYPRNRIHDGHARVQAEEEAQPNPYLGRAHNLSWVGHVCYLPSFSSLFNEGRCNISQSKPERRPQDKTPRWTLRSRESHQIYNTPEPAANVLMPSKDKVATQRPRYYR